jgi:hypothetical protein
LGLRLYGDGADEAVGRVPDFEPDFELELELDFDLELEFDFDDAPLMVGLAEVPLSEAGSSTLGEGIGDIRGTNEVSCERSAVDLVVESVILDLSRLGDDDDEETEISAHERSS